MNTPTARPLAEQFLAAAWLAAITTTDHTENHPTTEETAMAHPQATTACTCGHARSMHGTTTSAAPCVLCGHHTCARYTTGHPEKRSILRPLGIGAGALALTTGAAITAGIPWWAAPTLVTAALALVLLALIAWQDHLSPNRPRRWTRADDYQAAVAAARHRHPAGRDLPGHQS